MPASPDRKQMRLPSALTSYLPALDLGLRLLCHRETWPDLPPRDARVRVSLTPSQRELIDQLRDLRPQPTNAVITAALICASKAPAYALPVHLGPSARSGADGDSEAG